MKKLIIISLLFAGGGRDRKNFYYTGENKMTKKSFTNLGKARGISTFLTKRKGFMVFILMTGILTNVPATELWNNFTSGMTKEQVVQRIKKVLQPKEYKTYQGWDNPPVENLNLIIYGPPYWDINRQRLPESASLIDVVSSNEAYYQFGSVYNISFYFYKSKLFGVKIIWSAKGTDLLEETKKKYGNYEKAEYYDQSSFAFKKFYYVYSWPLDDKYLFVKTEYEQSQWGDDLGSLIILDKKIVDEYPAEKEKELEQERLKAEEKRQADKSRIQF